MSRKQFVASVSRGLLYGAGVAAGTYAAYAGTTWLRYGHVRNGADDDRDPLLDGFMPTYEVVERHHIRVAAPADVTFAAACDVDFQQSAVIRAIFKGRELMLGSAPDETKRPRGLLELTKSLGWGVLAEIPGREVVVGAVTQPWKANVVFRAVAPDRFAAFNEPDYVKIAWTLRADPLDGRQSIARSETRVMTTDAGRTEEVPQILVACLAGNRDHSARRDDPRESRRRTPSSRKVFASRDRFNLASGGDLDPQC